MNEDNNMKWMYEGKNSSIDHEQYLLGKKITTLHDDDEEKGDFSIAQQQSSIATGNVTVLERLDYESKVREDPLFEIRKNDYEHRKALLSNPFKKKRIQSMLKNALENDLRRKSARTRALASSSSESSDSDSDIDDVSDKYVQSSMKDAKLREALKEKLKKDLRDRKKSEKNDSQYRKTDSRKGNRDQSEQKQRNESLRSTSSKDNHDSEAVREKERAKKAGYGLTYIRDGERKSAEVKPRKHRRKRSPSPEPEKPKYTRKHRPGFSSKLSEKELERKRREMVENASWRDDQRKLNVKKFNLDEEKEEERANMLKREVKSGKRGKDFLHDMKLHSATMGSVEDTVRRKKHALSKKI